MLATALTTSLLGLEANLVRVEVDSSRGPASFDLVGLAEASVRESRVRVRSALAGLGVLLDEQRIVVNLAPGDVRKTGSAFDLAVAMATVAALCLTPEGALDGIVFLGELSLTGELRPVRGVLPQLLHARSLGIRRAIVPRDNGAEAAVVTGVATQIATSLSDVIGALARNEVLDDARYVPAPRVARGVDLSDVRGQHGARRALEIAAAGGHHVLMMGPPGGGKTMLARRLPTILPPLTEEEALEASAVHSIAGLLSSSQGLLTERPFRAPHHTVSDAGLVGGGLPVRPGELSLAHHGVLFLDELPEFRRQTLETLRQPLEDGMLVVARARSTATFPARPLVIAACNPCPCGYHRDGSSRCACSPERVRSYLARLSGPLVDRLDLHVVLPPVDVASLSRAGVGEASSCVRERVAAAREIQLRRSGGRDGTARTNATLGPAEVQAVALPDEDGQRLLTAAVARLGLSARAFTKVLRVARTIADLAGEPTVHAPHVAEAVQMRVFDRGQPRSTLHAAAPPS